MDKPQGTVSTVPGGGMNFQYRPQKVKRPRMMPEKPTAPLRCPGHKAEVRKYPCCVAGRLKPPHDQCKYVEDGKSDPHHVKTRGAGGGDEMCAPVCRYHHDLLDSPGWSQARMEKEAGINFEAIAAHHASISDPLKRHYQKQRSAK